MGNKKFEETAVELVRQAVDNSRRWTGSDWIEGAKLEPTPTAPTEVDQLKLMVGNLVAENAKKDQSIKQCYDWGVYTAEYVKSFFVDECQTITQEQYEQIVAAKQ